MLTTSEIPVRREEAKSRKVGMIRAELQCDSWCEAATGPRSLLATVGFFGERSAENSNVTVAAMRVVSFIGHDLDCAEGRNRRGRETLRPSRVVRPYRHV